MGVESSEATTKTMLSKYAETLDMYKILKGAVIRSTNDHGTYIVGCRMLEDNMAIKDYVKERIKE